jgi:hypothetical protein
MFKFLQRRREEAERRRREAAVAACRAELERTYRADARFVRTPQDMTSRAALLETARRAGAGDAEAVRQLDCLQRLLTVLRIENPGAATMLPLITEARSLGLAEAQAVRTLAGKHALAVLRKSGPQVIERDADGRRVYLRCLADHENRTGEYEVREDGITFSGEVRIEIPWTTAAHVAETAHEYQGSCYRAIAIQERTRRTATKFVFVDGWTNELACEVTVRMWQQFRAAAREAPAPS